VPLHEIAKKYAENENKTITEIIEDVVQSSLNRKKQSEARFSVS
jgi:hypothetical protein